MNEIKIPSEAVLALKSGDKVKAVKITREYCSVKLSIALDSVNKFLVNNPDTHSIFLESQKKRNRLLIIIINIGVLLLSLIHI